MRASSHRLSGEYAAHPPEILFVREVMRTNVAAIPARLSGRELAHSLHTDHTVRRGQQLYPLVDEEQRLVGVVTRGDLERYAKGGDELTYRDPVVAYPDEPLRMVVHRMALSDLLRARTQSLEQERHRERVLRIHVPMRIKRPVA